MSARFSTAAMWRRKRQQQQVAPSVPAAPDEEGGGFSGELISETPRSGRGGRAPPAGGDGGFSSDLVLSDSAPTPSRAPPAGFMSDVRFDPPAAAPRGRADAPAGFASDFIGVDDVGDIDYPAPANGGFSAAVVDDEYY